MSPKILALIPARGGSKGIKNKNIVRVLDKPLIYYTIREAKKVALFSDIIVSTDSKKIKKICENLGCEVPFLRSQDLATDNSKTIDAVREALVFLSSQFGKTRTS